MVTENTKTLYNLSYGNHRTNKTGYLLMGVAHADAHQRARLWCSFMSANAPRGVLYTQGEWTAVRDQWGVFEQCEVWSGADCVGTFVVRAVGGVSDE